MTGSPTSPHSDEHDQPETPPTRVRATESGLEDVRFGLLAIYRWLTFILPLAVYMALATLEPTPPKPVETDATKLSNASPQSGPGDQNTRHDVSTSEAANRLRYPALYTLRIAVTMAAIWFVWPGFRAFPLRVSWLGIGVGTLGVVIWVGFCRLDLESKILVPLGLGSMLGLGERAAFNPFQQLGDRPALMLAFLGIRFWGLAAVVPLIEEFFLRGFLMRFVVDPDWWKVPIGKLNTAGIVTGTLYGVLSHPAEMFAAAAWFSLITWLMIRSRNIWDCVAAHALTNLLLGVYVLTSGDWSLW